MKSHEKVLLGCMVAVFAFVALVAIWLMMSTPSVAKSTGVSYTPAGIPSNLRYFNGKFYVRADINEIVITGDDYGYFIDGEFYAPCGGFMPKSVYNQTRDPEPTPDVDEEVEEDDDIEDVTDVDLDDREIVYESPEYNGELYGTDFVI